MTMKRILNITTLMVLLLASSCYKEDPLEVDDIPGLGGDTWVPTALDRWIYDNLTVPFNVAVKYKWDQFELDLDKSIVPPKEEKVIPVMETIKRVWMNTYIAEGGEVFFKKYCPKFFVLAGSASWNLDGSITLGTAEGGRKVVLYQLNEFMNKTMPGYSPADSSIAKQMFHVIEHEFAHILDQNIRRQVEFDAVSAGYYTADWINTNDAEARRNGFITAYAQSKNSEDFAEMISLMLIEGRAGFNAIVNSITGTSERGITAEVAKAKLREKEALVVEYFKKAWDIDFYSLQNRKRQAIVNELY